ncbi:MAG: hypothetical protein F2540_02650, partial [Actinobacteria bacterium]|nr:hypothetical protein [Actinomycetota bacterium]
MIRQLIFSGETDGQIWLAGSPLKADSNILVTVTSATGEQSAYISKNGVT